MLTCQELQRQIYLQKFPDRFIDVGIAEQNMFGIAAGLSTFGKIPYASIRNVCSR